MVNFQPNQYFIGKVISIFLCVQTFSFCKMPFIKNFMLWCGNIWDFLSEFVVNVRYLDKNTDDFEAIIKSLEITER